MTFRAEDEKRLLREFIEWLYQHEWLVTPRGGEHHEDSKRS